MYPVNRPSINDNKVLEAALKEMAANITVWIAENDYSRRYHLQIVQELKNAMIFSTNAYGMAKQLEDHYQYLPDFALVNILHRLDSLMHKAYENMVYQWIREHRIQPEHMIGDVVYVDVMGTMQESMITDIELKRAKYIVKVILPNVNKDEDSFYNICVNYEDAYGTCPKDGKFACESTFD